MDFESLLTPNPKQTDGVWIYFADSGMEFLIASARQRSHQDFIAKRFNDARRGRRNLPEDVANRILVDGVLRNILKGWRPKDAANWFKNKDGSDVPFNKENARKLLEGDSAEASRIRDFIIEESQNDFNFSREDEEDGEKTESASPAEQLKSGSEVVA